MNELFGLDWSNWVTTERIVVLAQALILLIVGYLVARLISSSVGRLVKERATAQTVMLVRRLIFYTLFILILISVLHQLGFNLSVLLGAAGVLTVAVGFASQTSASNLISGLFLIAERPFVVGDVITVSDVTGEVLSIDLLSVKLRTFDNLFVRVPNETIIKSRITNLTHFPLRRVDIQIGVAYKEDLERVKDLLLELAERNPYGLAEPEPLFIFKGFGDSSLDMQFSIWGMRENFLALRNSLQMEIKQAFDAEGIEIPFPQRTLHAGSAAEPIAVQVVPPPRTES